MDIPNKVTGSSLTAAEFMQIVTELEQQIADVGQVVSSADLGQVSKSTANYVANGSFYVDSGAADAYVLSGGGSKKGITAYQEGMSLLFKVSATNTGASTVNVNSLGNKAITDFNGNALTAGQLLVNDYVEIIFVNASNHFRIIQSKANVNNSIDNTDSPYSAKLTDELLLVDTSAAAVTVNLYAVANNSGKTIIIKKTSSSNNAVTIDANASETIDGKLTRTLDFQYEWVKLYCDGSAWHVIAFSEESVQYDITVTSTNWTTLKAVGNPYKKYDDSGNLIWRLNLTIVGTFAGAASNNSHGVIMSNVTSKNVGSYNQALTLTDHGTQGRAADQFNSQAYSVPNGGQISWLTSSSISPNNQWSISGDIELESKPTWIL
jgi:hypothetical protein